MGRPAEFRPDQTEHKAKTVAAGPAPAEAQAPVEVCLFEDDAVADAALVEVSLQTETGFAANGEWFPAAAVFTDDGFAAGGFGEFCYFVVRVVREQGEFGAATACGDASVAGGKGPEVAAANDVHEERRQCVDVFDFKIIRILHLR